ncbi:hypothetical protein ANN_04541 [Periplaneta americana]|uniref:Glucosylceramidase n=1 Tax=Periplaneta americana TaxID=6978 RepID=A0ABQ8T9L3_PERAM|nr:hypothetical protein ANN_04541 [Periplaneta americana]
MHVQYHYLMDLYQEYPGSGVHICSINSSDLYQEIYGFGGAITDSVGINLKSLSNDAQEMLLRQYFGCDSIHYTFLRVPMAGTDFSTRFYTYDDKEGDENLSHFNLAMEDYEYKIPYIRRAQKLSQDWRVKTLALPWSPPIWMTETVNSEKHYVRLKDKYYQTLANYFVKQYIPFCNMIVSEEEQLFRPHLWSNGQCVWPRNQVARVRIPVGASYLVEVFPGFSLNPIRANTGFLDAYREEDVEFWAVSPQNEPGNGFDVYFKLKNFCGYSPEEQRKLIAKNLGPTLKNNGYEDVKIMSFEDQRNNLPNWTDIIYDVSVICQPDRSRLVPVAWQQWSEMEALIPSPAACEVRSVIKFFNAQSIAPIEIHRQLCQVYGPNIMSKHERSGRPSLINDDRVELVRKCIMENRRFTITELSSHFSQISRSLLALSTCCSKKCVPGAALTFLQRYHDDGDEFLDRIVTGETVNADRYCETLRKLRRAIQNKRRGLLTAGVVLLHDNARPHTARRTAAVLAEFGWELFDHPPYSPDLAPSDFSRFLAPQEIPVLRFYMKILEDEEAYKYTAGISVHWYFDNTTKSSRLQKTHEHYPDKFILYTEASLKTFTVPQDVRLRRYLQSQMRCWLIVASIRKAKKRVKAHSQ